MKFMNYGRLCLAAGLLSLPSTLMAAEADINRLIPAQNDTQVHGVFRLRYENVSQENTNGAQALTLGSNISVESEIGKGLSGFFEIEDTRIVAGVDRYAVPAAGFHAGEYATIGDPEVTEVNQAYLNFNQGAFSARAGRQLIRLDNQRFVGSASWRQDEMTFDALGLQYSADRLSLAFYAVGKRNRGVAELADVRTQDLLLNASYALPEDVLVAYYYDLNPSAPGSQQLKSAGFRLQGHRRRDQFDMNYQLEFAHQNALQAGRSFGADYWLVSTGFHGGYGDVVMGYEHMGSDHGLFGVTFPAGAHHGVNGWADKFLVTPAVGLVDEYLEWSIGGLGGTLSVDYHDFRAAYQSHGQHKLGTEVDMQYQHAFGDHYVLGVTMADFRQVDFKSYGDTRKYWIWLAADF